MVCDRDIVSSGKEISVLRLLGRALFGDSIYLRRYPNSTGILDSYRWSLPVGEESKEVHMAMSEVWNMNWSEEIWINPVHVKLYPRFEIGTDWPRFEIGIDWDRLYPRFEIWVDRNRWMVYDGCKPLSLTQCTSVFRK